MLTILVVSIPRAEQMLHLINKATMTNFAVIILVAIIFSSYFLFHFSERAGDMIFVCCVIIGLVSAVLSGYNGLQQQTEAQGDIQYERAIKISHKYPHLQVKSKPGKRYTRLMETARQDGINVHTPQWWQYL